MKKFINCGEKDYFKDCDPPPILFHVHCQHQWFEINKRTVSDCNCMAEAMERYKKIPSSYLVSPDLSCEHELQEITVICANCEEEKVLREKE